MHPYVKAFCAAIDSEWDSLIAQATNLMLDELYYGNIREELNEEDYVELLKRGFSEYEYCHNPKLETMIDYEILIDFDLFSSKGHINEEIFNHFKDKFNMKGVIQNQNLNQDMKEIIEEYKLLMEVI